MTAKIKLNAASGGGSVSLKAPSTTTSNAAVELQLPVADGTSGQVIKTDGSGNLSFAADAGGKIIGQYYATSTAEFTSTSGSFQNAHTITFTPASATSKFLIIFMPARVVTQSGLDGEIRFSDGSAASQQYRLGNGGSTYKTPSIVFWHNFSRSGSTTFTAQTRDISGGSNGFMLGDNGSPSTIIVLEIEQ